MSEAKEKISNRTPRWQQILGLVLLLSVALAFLLNGLRGRHLEFYPHFGGGFFIEPSQQIAVGILPLAFTVWLLASEFLRKGRKGGSKPTAEHTDGLGKQ